MGHGMLNMVHGMLNNDNGNAFILYKLYAYTIFKFTCGSDHVFVQLGEGGGA